MSRFRAPSERKHWGGLQETVTKTVTKEQRTAEAVANKLLGVKLYQCGGECDFGTDDIGDLHPIDDLYMRVDAGELLPAGQCPECGGLIDPAERDIQVAPLVQHLRRLGYTVIEPEA